MLTAFIERFEKAVADNIQEKSLTPEVEYDIELPFKSINQRFMNILKTIRSFWSGQHESGIYDPQRVGQWLRGNCG
jgi:single-stranded DNA-specific DHH superfamily exonuclease